MLQFYLHAHFLIIVVIITVVVVVVIAAVVITIIKNSHPKSSSKIKPCSNFICTHIFIIVIVFIVSVVIEIILILILHHKSNPAPIDLHSQAKSPHWSTPLPKSLE